MTHLIRLLALLAIASHAFADATKIKIEKLDDLPRHMYKIDMKAAELLDNSDALMKLAKEYEKDLNDDLSKYEISDKTTLKNYYVGMCNVALLEGRYDDYLKYVKLRQELEDKAPQKLTTALFMRAWVAAKQSGDADFPGRLKTELAALVTALPYADCSASIKSQKGSMEMVSKDLIVGSLNGSVQPVLDGSDGEMSKDIAEGLIGSAVQVRFIIPSKEVAVDVYGNWIAANDKPKEDIWAARDFVLSEKDGKAPVVLGIWDSGVDTEIFSKSSQIWINKKEIPGNNKDDDGNGYTDDIHGIAYSLHSDKEIPLLFDVGDVGTERPRLQRLMKGLQDMSSAIESPEKAELMGVVQKLPQDSVTPFFENVGKYGNYCHGTHVAGIASAGNPFARILAGRLTFDYHAIPEKPTIEQAKKDATAQEEFIDYFKQNGVRVVNMSWGGSLSSVEQALEANNAGGTPEERKKLAREIFEIGKVSLFEAIKNAPDILFVTSAGNSNNDNAFEEFIPSSFALPNVLTVGAVDQAGDETSFTSFGKTDVYANGFEVVSYVPGGDRMALNGTSMSSPQVTGLAGKLLAKSPKLSTIELRDLIIKGCDDKQAGDRVVKLINPKKSLELLGNGKS